MNSIYYVVETLVSNLGKPKPYDVVLGYLNTYQEAYEKVKELDKKYPKYTANDGNDYPRFRVEMMPPFSDEEIE